MIQRFPQCKKLHLGGVTSVTKLFGKHTQNEQDFCYNSVNCDTYYSSRNFSDPRSEEDPKLFLLNSFP